MALSRRKKKHVLIGVSAGVAGLLLVGGGMVIAAENMKSKYPQVSDQVSSYYESNRAVPTQAKDPALRPLKFAAGTKTVVFGDSWTEGLFMQPKTLGFAHVAAADLGLSAQILGGSGTGYLNTGKDGLGTYAMRLRSQSGPDVEMLVLQGSVNDTNQNINNLGRAFDDTIAAARSAYPKAQIVILGPAPSKVPAPVVVFDVDRILSGKAKQYGFHYISPYTQKWIDEKNYPTMMNAENTHPTVEGHIYLAHKLEDALKAARDIPEPAEPPVVVNPSQSSITAPAKLSSIPSGAKVLFFGDSYTAGTGANDGSSEGFAPVLASSQGWAPTLAGGPGTGFTSDNGQPGGAYPDRIKQAPAGSFDIVLIQGGQNDRLAEPAALIQAVQKTLATAKEKWPSAQIVVMGPAAPQPLSSKLTQATAVIETAVADKAVYINPTRLGWFTTANSGQYTASDGAHLNAAGHAYLASKLAETLASLQTR